MNKLMGFLELKESSLPTVPIKEYNEKEYLDPEYLWTVRTAVHRGDDLNLPRKVGVTSGEAVKFANDIKRGFGDNIIVFFYPYFIAEKSGTLEVRRDEIIIEAVKEDLWNLVTYSRRDVTYRIKGEQISIDGNGDFLTKQEIESIKGCVNKIRSMFRDYLLEGYSVLLEWSYAVNTNSKKEKLGNPYLVFYEARTI